MTNTLTTADIADLIDKYLRQGLSSEEREKLERWLSDHEENRAYFDKITDPGAIEKMAEALLDISVRGINRKFEARRRGLE